MSDIKIEESDMEPVFRKIDFSKVRKVVYHMPEGESLVFAAEEIEQAIDLNEGRVCDTSDINGVIHFFPRGFA